MRAYSQDLRDRVISKYNTGEYQIKQLASMYQMSRQTIGGWIKRYKATGDYGSRQHLSKGRKIIFNDRKKVLEYLDKNPNSDGITIRDNVAHDVAMSTFYDALSRMKITYKKKSQDITEETKMKEKSLVSSDNYNYRSPTTIITEI